MLPLWILWVPAVAVALWAWLTASADRTAHADLVSSRGPEAKHSASTIALERAVQQRITGRWFVAWGLLVAVAGFSVERLVVTDDELYDAVHLASALVATDADVGPGEVAAVAGRQLQRRVAWTPVEYAPDSDDRHVSAYELEPVRGRHDSADGKGAVVCLEVVTQVLGDRRTVHHSLSSGRCDLD